MFVLYKFHNSILPFSHSVIINTYVLKHWLTIVRLIANLYRNYKKYIGGVRKWETGKQNL